MRWISPFRLHPAIPTLFLATGLSIVACRGGGTSPDPNRESASAPTITDVRLVAGVLMSGETVQLKADVSNLVTRWNWDIGTGAAPQTSRDAEPSVQLLAVGRHQGQVWATNGFGTSEPFVFPYSISPAVAPKLGPISPDGLWMSTGKITRFTLPADPAGGLPTSYQWVMNGGEIVGPTNNSVVAFRADHAGFFSGSVIASNSYGSGDSSTRFMILQAPDLDVVEISGVGLSRGAYGITPSFHIFGESFRKQLSWSFDAPAAWQFGTTEENGDYDLPSFTLLSGTSDRISGTVRACEWDWNCDAELAFDLAVTLQPAGPTWIASPVAGRGEWIEHAAALALIDDRPTVIFRKNGESRGGPLYCSQALTAEPRLESDWATHEVLDFSSSQSGTPDIRLLDRNGHPFIEYLDPDESFRMIEATSSDPSTAADWQHLIYAPLSNGGIGRDLAIDPAGNIWGAITTDAFGLSIHHLPAGAALDGANWESHSVTFPKRKSGFRLAVFQGRPIIVADVYSGAGSDNLYCFLSARETPTTAADWSSYSFANFDFGFFAPNIRSLESDGGQLRASYRLNEEGTTHFGLLQTSAPAGGATAWEQLEGAHVDARGSTLFRDHLQWKGRLLQVDDAYAIIEGPLLLSRSDHSNAPLIAEDWFVTTPEPDLRVPDSGILAASDTHLYLLGIRGKTTPTLFWTTDDF